MRVTVTGLGFVPEGPHNEYDSGAWMTSAGYDRLFHNATYILKFRGLQIVLRHGVSVAAATKRLNVIARSVLGGQTPGFGPPPLPQAILEVRDVAVLPFALGSFLALLALGAVGHALAAAVRRRRHELAVLRRLASPGCSPGSLSLPRQACWLRSGWRSGGRSELCWDASPGGWSRTRRRCSTTRRWPP
jgi:hypothetical protein